MSGATEHRPNLSSLVDGLDMTPELVTRLVAVALTQANVVETVLDEVVIACLPPKNHAFAQDLARKISQGAILEENFPGDLRAFTEILDDRIGAGTHRYWHGDEHHVRGGYEAVYREPEILPLAHARTELAVLADMVRAARIGARALREARALLES